MANSIYEDIICGMSRDKLQEKYKIDAQTISDIASSKIDYDALSGQERDKVLHTLSLISSKSWTVLEQCPIETKAKVLDLLRRLTHDRAEILGLTKQEVKIESDITISWKQQ